MASIVVLEILGGEMEQSVVPIFIRVSGIILRSFGGKLFLILIFVMIGMILVLSLGEWGTR